eukprot:EG_transcript_17083
MSSSENDGVVQSTKEKRSWKRGGKMNPACCPGVIPILFRIPPFLSPFSVQFWWSDGSERLGNVVQCLPCFSALGREGICKATHFIVNSQGQPPLQTGDCGKAWSIS